MKKPGKYKLIVIAAAVAVAALTASIIYYYSSQHSLALRGDPDVTVGLFGVYEDKGVMATLGGKDASDKVKTEGSVDTSKPGKYVIKYSLEGMSIERSVTVLDKMDPELTLKGEESMSIKLGEEFSDPGWEARDREGNDITADVEVSDTDFRKAGTHYVTYTAKDSDGRATRIKRKVDVEPNVDLDSPGLPICMYHYVYDEEDPPEDLHRRYGNYISAQDLEEELNWLNEEGYYYPDWEEVRDYIDGKLILPDKSIVLCFDDGAKSFLENGIPVLEKCKVPATCFMITSSDGENKVANYKSDYVRYESHSHNMHRPGGSIGHGGIFTAISEEEGLADLKESIRICGSGRAFAYPYGDYNDRSRKMVESAGFLCAVTTQYGKAHPGDDPLLLPRVRMVMGQSLEKFISAVEP